MRPQQMTPARCRMAELAREADKVSQLVLRDDYPEIDVVLAIDSLRAAAEDMFPGSGELFEMIYVSRFRRLWDQFRRRGDAPF